jgi:crotonobetainyl-CoA:carnitine CoA-transferase CaiB-like acyl-CoA transferase
MALSLSPLSALADAIGEPRLATYADKDPWTKQDEISELIAQRLATATTAEWTKRMEPLGIWHAPVQDYAQIVDDPQVKHMKSLVTVAGTGKTGAPVTLVNHPVLYDGETASVRLPPQPLGAQTEEILKELGLGPADIQSLVADKVVRLGDV